MKPSRIIAVTLALFAMSARPQRSTWPLCDSPALADSGRGRNDVPERSSRLMTWPHPEGFGL